MHARSWSCRPGYTLVWSGQYENLVRVRERLKLVMPLTLFLIALLLYMNTSSGVKTAIVLLAVPFSLVGAVWLLWALGYNMSIAVWVGMIALMGLDAETGVFMLLFLDLAYEERVRAGTMRTRADLEEAIVHGAVKRVRPKMMTVTAAFMGLLPIMWATGSGADVMKRIAAPMVGGLARRSRSSCWCTRRSTRSGSGASRCGAATSCRAMRATPRSYRPGSPLVRDVSGRS